MPGGTARALIARPDTLVLGRICGLASVGMEPVLFCPFCREAYEGATHCPEHELALVPFARLPVRAKPVTDDEPLAWYSPRLGRGFVAFGALLTALAFAVTPIATVEEPVRMGGVMLRLALLGTPKLWLIPMAVLAQAAVLYRRRTPRAMRGARVVVPLVSLVPTAAALWTLHGIFAAVSLWAARNGQQLEPRLGAGVYLIASGGLLMLWGGLRFGVLEGRDSVRCADQGA